MATDQKELFERVQLSVRAGAKGPRFVRNVSRVASSRRTPHDSFHRAHRSMRRNGDVLVWNVRTDEAGQIHRIPITLSSTPSLAERSRRSRC